jgi:hypothetical protein
MATVIAGSEFRALPWARPKHRKYIEPIEAAISRLEAAVQGSGVMFEVLCASAPIFDQDGPQERSRRMRSDGRRNLVSLAQALVAAADLATGYLGSPIGAPGQQRWDRHAWGRLDHRAFGKQVECERSFRRTQRHARTLAALGFVSVTEIKVSTGQGTWRSVIAIKRLTERFFAALGLSAAVKRARKERDRAKGIALIAQLSNVPRRKRAEERAPAVVSGSVEAPGTTTPPSSFRPPPDDPVVPAVPVADAIAMAKAALGIR